MNLSSSAEVQTQKKNLGFNEFPSRLSGVVSCDYTSARTIAQAKSLLTFPSTGDDNYARGRPAANRIGRPLFTNRAFVTETAEPAGWVRICGSLPVWSAGM